ncbi:hypothetical protein KIW84_073738 [Lathyrus oleraceus]|uniref:Uncharacterized protein n=1 Tax=Pisum sativum TaxID=3888 RepID=A0A9D4VS45_PEA|nr:hypothetical protein KIW84_073738 [Pisum sativum]
MKELIELEHLEYWLWWYNSDVDKYSRMVSDNDVDKVYQYAMVMKCAIHIYVEHKGKVNAEEAGVGDFQEDNIGGVEQVREDNVGGVEQVEEANVSGVEQVEDTEDNEDSDFEPDGLSFDHSEDETTLELDN